MPTLTDSATLLLVLLNPFALSVYLLELMRTLEARSDTSANVRESSVRMSSSRYTLRANGLSSTRSSVAESVSVGIRPV